MLAVRHVDSSGLVAHAGRQANGLQPAKPQASQKITKPLLRLYSAPVMVQQSSSCSLSSSAETQGSSYKSRRFTNSSSLLAQLGTIYHATDMPSPSPADSTRSASLPLHAQPPLTTAPRLIREPLGRAVSIKATAAFQGGPPSQLGGLVLPHRLPSYQVLLPIVHTESTCNNGAPNLPARVQSVFGNSQPFDLQRVASTQQSSLSMAEAAVEAAPLSRRASLATMLLRQSPKSQRNSEHRSNSRATGPLTGRLPNVSMTHLRGNALRPLDRSANTPAEGSIVFAETSQGGMSQHAFPRVVKQQAANQPPD